MSELRSVLTFVVYLVVATVLGAFLAGTADVVAADAIGGTALGASSEASPILWTLIGLAVVVGGTKVIDG